MIYDAEIQLHERRSLIKPPDVELYGKNIFLITTCPRSRYSLTNLFPFVFLDDDERKLFLSDFYFPRQTKPQDLTSSITFILWSLFFPNDL